MEFDLDLIITLLIFLMIFTVVLSVFFLVYSAKNKMKIKKKIEKISNESKLLAIDELRKMVKNNPNDFNSREKLADLLVETKSYLPAIKEYMTILDRHSANPDVSEVKFTLKIADSYILLNNVEEARKYYIVAKKIDDFNLRANQKLAEIELSLGNADVAYSYVKVALKIKPEDSDILKLFADASYQCNMFSDAVSAYSLVLKDRPDDNKSLYNLANSMIKLKRYDDAVKKLSQLAAIPEYASGANYELGMINYRLKSFTQAAEFFEAALTTGGLTGVNMMECLYSLSECYVKNQNMNKAVTYLSRLISIDANYKDAAQKYDSYQQLSQNTLMQKYLIGSVAQFTNLCKVVVKYVVNKTSSLRGGTISFNKINTTNDGCLEVFAEIAGGKFSELYFFTFVRSTTTVGELTMRTVYAKQKELKADRAICVTAGDFSPPAREFVESRMLELIEKSRLNEILTEIYNSNKG